MQSHPARTPSIVLALALAACSLSPLQNRIEVGEERFVVFVAEGRDGSTDIFAGLPAGGELSRITFTPVEESHPALTPQGDAVAFIRHPPPSAMAIPRLVVVNLINGAERTFEGTPLAGGVEGLAWSPDADALVLRSGATTWRIAFPFDGDDPVQLEGAARAAADSLIDVYLGTPAFARATACDGGGVCVVGPSGAPTRISDEGRDPFRWGSDSLAWFEDDRLMVRPLGAGAARTITWQVMPENMRQGSYAWRVAQRAP